ncbi:hypothetical protein JOC86_003659 [Bacillus pakistanensis]|uniref:Uncharacterized protein n=1 Tax=Rossellomorea pakistanensis TaxID=992288 RepID=A0ABS2NGU4_9BACI|nr:hypothetical protein [Bacillus pakistanensis]
MMNGTTLYRGRFFVPLMGVFFIFKFVVLALPSKRRFLDKTYLIITNLFDNTALCFYSE